MPASRRVPAQPRATPKAPDDRRAAAAVAEEVGQSVPSARGTRADKASSSGTPVGGDCALLSCARLFRHRAGRIDDRILRRAAGRGAQLPPRPASSVPSAVSASSDVARRRISGRTQRGARAGCRRAGADVTVQSPPPAAPIGRSAIVEHDAVPVRSPVATVMRIAARRLSGKRPGGGLLESCIWRGTICNRH